jgi:ribonucleoside-diphosphate reductase alpha chain
MGYNECFEAFTSNLYKRKTLAGEFIVANKYMMTDSMELGLWNQDLKDALMVHEGSIQNIAAIPQEIRDRYKTVWEIKQKVVIDMAADRGRYVCQSQSMNLFVEDPDFKRLSSMHFYAWGKGLKTGMYYLRTKPKAAAQQFTVDPRKANAAASAGAKPAITVTPPVAATESGAAVASPKLKPPQVKAEAEGDDDEPEQQAVGCKWKPGCKTCSS